MSAPTFKPTEPHPVLQLPTPEESLRMGMENWQKAMEKREQAIRDEVVAPLWRCFEPPIWKVMDALWGAPWLNEKEAEAIRVNLNFRKPVNILLLLGGWGSGKTEYAANRESRLMQMKENGIFWFLHETVPSAQDQQHPIVYKYLPPNLKGTKNILEKTTYISYKEKTGFSDGSFVLPNHSKGRFWTYQGGVDALQGPTVHAAWGDELMPPEFVTAVGSRVSRANGIFFITFAPIHGYTATVQEFCDGAEVCREITAFLNPMDGGPRDVGRYLGLNEDEVARLRTFFERREKPPFPNVPWSRPEDCSKWLTGEPSQMAVPDGRRFKKVPRVLKPQDPEESRAVVLLNGSDNPYGKPLSVFTLNASVSEEIGNRYFYGFAKEGKARMFPRFGREHLIEPKAIPSHGTNFQWVDPAGRNWFMLWIRVTRGAAYVYREWPGNYEIPGQGVPGPWALPDGKLADGKRGPAQDSFGFSLCDYKREVARLEGWKDMDEPPKENMTESEWIQSWYQENGARENVSRRFIDSRFASTPHIEKDRPVTLAENLAEIALPYELTPGDSVKEGVDLINDALRFDPSKKVDALNCPKLYISKDCTNTIFALRTWRNMDGSRSATGDPIACLRYFVLQGVRYVAPEDYASSGGGHY